MFRISLIAKVFTVCLLLTGSVTSSQAIEGLEDFDDIFGESFSDTYSKKSYRGHDYVFSAPYYKRRPRGRNTIIAKVDLSDQRMRVYINNALWQEWKVSSGGRGYRTPTGRYRPTRLHEEWYSRKYFNTPMPHSVFFHGGYAIHATTYLGSLGRPASHGCVRLHPQHARAFFNLVRDFGMHKTKIIVTN